MIFTKQEQNLGRLFFIVKPKSPDEARKGAGAHTTVRALCKAQDCCTVWSVTDAHLSLLRDQKTSLSFLFTHLVLVI